MQFAVLNNGNLRLQAEPADFEELSDMLDKTCHKDHGFLADMLEYTGWEGNGHLYAVRPESIGALTDSPILSDDAHYDDDGTQVVPGRVWWYPNYMVSSFAEELIANGQVIFTKAPENDTRH